MKIVTRGERGDFAPFDLTKTPKFNRKTQKVELAINSYDLANKYLGASKLLLDKCYGYIPVALTNVSFSCELYLKALLYGYNIDFGNTHGLKDLFDKLPNDIKEYIRKNIAIENRDKEFALCLTEQSQAFVFYRYMNEAKSITANPTFLFAFALILKHVYEALIEEYSKL